MLHRPTRLSAARARPAMVLLADELGRMRDDLAAAQARFDDRLIIDVFCSADAALVPVPAGLLRPLAERAVELGVARRDDRMVLSLFARMTGRILRLILRSETAPDLADDEGRDALCEAREALAEAVGTRGNLSVERVGHYSAVTVTIDDGLRPRG